MSTAIPPDVRHDRESLCNSAASGRPADPVIVRHIPERAERIEAEIRKRGTTNVAVELIREVREE